MAKLETITPEIDNSHLTCPNCKTPYTGVKYYTGVVKNQVSSSISYNQVLTKTRYSDIKPHTGGLCRCCEKKNNMSYIRFGIIISAIAVILIVLGALNIKPISGFQSIIMTVGIIMILIGGFYIVSTIIDMVKVRTDEQISCDFIQTMKAKNMLKPGLTYMSPWLVSQLKPDDINDPGFDLSSLLRSSNPNVSKVPQPQKTSPQINTVTNVPKAPQTSSKTDTVSEAAKTTAEDIPQSVKSVWNELNGMGFTVSVEEINAAVQAKRNEFAARRIAYFGSDFELALGTLVLKELPDPYERYAKEITNIFAKPLNKDTYQSELRKIGEKIDHNHKQILVVKRAEVLCRKLAESGNRNAGNFSISTMEYAWAGLGGWMP